MTLFLRSKMFFIIEKHQVYGEGALQRADRQQDEVKASAFYQLAERLVWRGFSIQMASMSALVKAWLTLSLDRVVNFLDTKLEEEEMTHHDTTRDTFSDDGEDDDDDGNMFTTPL
eukprot:gene5264-18500_t